MPIGRFYCDCPLKPQAVAIVSEQEFHHLVHVVRAKHGETVTLVNGKGILAAASIEKIEKNRAILRIASTTERNLPAFRTILALAEPRLPRLRVIVEKGTELGMTDLWVFPGHHGEKNILGEHHLQKMKAIAISAMKQCGRLDLPSLNTKPPLSQWEELPFTAYFGDLSPHAPTLIHIWQTDPPRKGILLFIGSETGFSQEELNRLHTLGAIGVKLHSNVLRNDTACLSALSLIHQLNDEKTMHRGI
ncbi:MAG: RsmE family RNA methyltransferase [Waddliaceae bacterium]